MKLLKEWDKIIAQEGEANRTTISSMIGTALANTRVDSWQKVTKLQIGNPVLKTTYWTVDNKTDSW